MRTKTELQQDILNIAMKIQMEFPELTEYIKEMPSLFLAKELDHKHTETLQLYYNKLKSVLVENSKSHFNLETTIEDEVVTFSSNTNSPNSKDSRTYGKVEMQLMRNDHSSTQIQDMIASEARDYRIL